MYKYSLNNTWSHHILLLHILKQYREHIIEGDLGMRGMGSRSHDEGDNNEEVEEEDGEDQLEEGDELDE